MPQKPKGTLIAIGYNECIKYTEVFERLLHETGKLIPKVCVFTLASDEPRNTEITFKNLFESIGVHDISIINFNLYTEADSEENLEKVKQANVIIFSNGSPLKLSSLLGGTHLMARIKKRYYKETNFIIMGVGAGASVLANTMITSFNSNDSMLKSEMQITNGLNLIKHVFIDTHFTERGKFGCLIQTVTLNPKVLGVGLSDDTVIVIKNEEIEVVGTGLLVIVDGAYIKYTDAPDIANGDPITVEGIKLHFLGTGKRFLLNEKQIQQTSKECAGNKLGVLI